MLSFVVNIKNSFVKQKKRLFILHRFWQQNKTESVFTLRCVTGIQTRYLKPNLDSEGFQQSWRLYEEQGLPDTQTHAGKHTLEETQHTCFTDNVLAGLHDVARGKTLGSRGLRFDAEHFERLVPVDKAPPMIPDIASSATLSFTYKERERVCVCVC